MVLLRKTKGRKMRKQALKILVVLSLGRLAPVIQTAVDITTASSVLGS